MSSAPYEPTEAMSGMLVSLPSSATVHSASDGLTTCPHPGQRVEVLPGPGIPPKQLSGSAEAAPANKPRLTQLNAKSPATNRIFVLVANIVLHLSVNLTPPSTHFV
jgi:hypothetical protein